MMTRVRVEAFMSPAMSLELLQVTGTVDFNTRYHGFRIQVPKAIRMSARINLVRKLISAKLVKQLRNNE